MHMHWRRWEWDIARKFTRYPRSATPREYTLLLLAIRAGLLGVALPVLGIGVLALGAIVGWYALAMAGVVLFIVGLALLVLAMLVGTCLTIIYGD